MAISQVKNTEPFFTQMMVLVGMISPLQMGVPGAPELLIIILIILLIILPFAMAYWVYKDAEARGEENAALWALAVGGLTFLTFFGGFLALAVYFWQRGPSQGSQL